ncbi:MAG: formimidoylglutamate deiminase, partial [Pyrinomonadaceae bacterium]|nr:formimidoylglutamate deiminase [Pyrinomonadaceae bacterium]
MKFKAILQKDGWHENVEIRTDDAGVIVSIDDADGSGTNLALPGFRNAHSHAFQYAMAGIAENHKDPNDDFWSWREAMYKLALSLDPDQMESIAALLYSEMLRNGYTHVAEFHYLHHDKNGARYDDPAEMAKRLIRAAETVGINLTIVPVYYRTGGFEREASESQKRFIFEDVDEYLDLLAAVNHACDASSRARIGCGVHSLRAAPIEDVAAIAESSPGDMPFHIHIAEQLKEVDECVAFHGKRPVELLLDSVEIGPRFNLVHSTYMNESELNRVADSRANVVICPTTEGNLGDGIFSLKHFRAKKGSWSIGSDSHIGIDPLEEIRLLDYGQRLVSRSRNTFGENGSHYAIETAFDAGQSGMGEASTDYFEVGGPLNACIVEPLHPLHILVSNEHLLNSLVYTSGTTWVSGS